MTLSASFDENILIIYLHCILFAPCSVHVIPAFVCASCVDLTSDLFFIFINKFPPYYLAARFFLFNLF